MQTFILHLKDGTFVWISARFVTEALVAWMTHSEIEIDTWEIASLQNHPDIQPTPASCLLKK